MNNQASKQQVRLALMDVFSASVKFRYPSKWRARQMIVNTTTEYSQACGQNQEKSEQAQHGWGGRDHSSVSQKFGTSTPLPWPPYH